MTPKNHKDFAIMGFGWWYHFDEFKGEVLGVYMDYLLEEARFKRLRQMNPLPWEQGPMQAIFGPRDRPFPWLDPGIIMNVPAISLPPAEATPVQRSERTVPSGAAEARDGPDPVVEDQRARAKALRSWHEILSLVGEASEVVRTTGKEEWEATVADVLANRETETLKARAWPLKHYIMWCVQSHQQPFPVDEKVFYKYLRELRDNNARAGKATCLTKAMAFLGHMFDVSSARAASRSKRVQGAAFVQLAGGATREGRSPFTVNQLRALQRGVVCLPAESDRIICGTVCALVAGRTRYQDLQRSTQEPVLDKAEDAPTYLEVRLGRTKTTN